MKITFIKPHLEWNPGDEAELDDGIGLYLIHASVATLETVDEATIEKVLIKKLKAGRPKKADVKEKEVVKRKQFKV
jgi:hypothetical protein